MKSVKKIWIVNFTFLIISQVHSSQQQYNGPCPASCSCSQVSTLELECHNSTTSALFLPSQAGAIFYNYVTHDDFHKPVIVRATSIRQLTWQYSQITDITSELLSNLLSLLHLDLSHNLITSFDEAALQHLSSLKLLNLSYNSISFLPHGLFLNNHYLTELYLEGNFIQSVPFHALAPLKDLNILDLSFNRINEIQDDIFVLNRKINSIQLQGNQISRLSIRTFSYLYDLKSLNLVNNSLTELPRSLFKDLSKLQYLNLASNSLHTLQPDIFKGLVQLRRLNISDNPIPLLHVKLFQFTPLLENLRADTTDIELIDGHLFNGLKNLKLLSMRNNMHLEGIADNIFDEVKKLREIDLSRNNLTTLPHSLHDLKNLTSLNISHNPWMCDCRMAWFPAWLESNKNMTLEKSNLRCASTLFSLRGLSFLPTLRGLDCTPPELIFMTPSEKYLLKSSALLQCIYSGYPPPSITWVTPRGLAFHWNPNPAIPDEFAKHPTAHYSDLSPIKGWAQAYVTENGSLLITNITRADAGLYLCLAANPMANATSYIRVMIDPITMHEEKLISIAVGIVTAAMFLGISLLINLLRRFLHIFACFACCKRDQISPNGRQIYQMLESIEQYKTEQLDKLKENYTNQVHRIKENCALQVEWIRESYQGQVQHLKDFRDYGTHHLTSMRDQYCDQIKRVREYSASQLNWVKENYVFQRNRIRKFSSHQILRFRESYKYQQATLGKLLETLPSLYLDNCRSGSSGKTESGVFEIDISNIDVYVKREGFFHGMSPGEACNADDSLSRLSVYYTPSEQSELPDASLEPLKSPYFSPMSRSSSKQPNFRFGLPNNTDNQAAVFQCLERTLERQLRDYINREREVLEAAPSALVPSSSLPEFNHAAVAKFKSKNRAHNRSASAGGAKSVHGDTSISRQIAGKHSPRGRPVITNASTGDYSSHNGHAVVIEPETSHRDKSSCCIDMDQTQTGSASQAAHETSL